MNGQPSTSRNDIERKPLLERQKSDLGTLCRTRQPSTRQRQPSTTIDIEGLNKDCLDEEQEKVLEQFRSRANKIKNWSPKNQPLEVLLKNIFNKFLYQWSDNIWMKYDKKQQNVIENFYYSLTSADFKFNVDELSYLIKIWELCKSRGINHKNAELLSSIIAFKELKQNLIIKKKGITWRRKALDKYIEKLNSNGYAVENVLTNLLHRQSFEVIQRFYQIYEKQTSYISYRADITYKKVIERVALGLATGSIGQVEKGSEFFHILLDHKKVGKNYIVKTETFKELQRFGAQRVIEIILSKKPFVGALDENKDLIMANINRQQFERFFTSLVNPPINNRRFIEMDLSCFFPPKEELKENPEYNEMKFFYHLADTKELKPLLGHPIIETLINLKYAKLSIFNWDLVLWRLLLMLIVLVNNICPNEIIRTLSIIGFGILFSGVFYSTCMLLTDIRTVVLAVLDGITFTFFFLFLYQNCAQSDCPNVTGLGGLLLAINITFILCYLFPHVSLNVFMLFIVARNAFKFIIAISIMLIGFAYCLSKNFGELNGFEYIRTDEHNNTISPNISHLQKTIFKTFLMLTGELEAQDIPYLHLMSYVIVLVFVFLFPIVSINLLSGLAVGDVQQIISNARLWRLTTITMFLYYYEKGLARRTWFNDVVDNRCTTVWNFVKNPIENLTIVQFIMLRHFTPVPNFLELPKLFKNIMEHLTISRNKCLYEDFAESSKIVFDLGTERVKLQNQPISRISSHTARYTTETIQEEKLRKRKNREEKKEIQEKEQAKNCAQQILDRIEKIEKKIEKLTQLQKISDRDKRAAMSNKLFF